MNIINLWIKKYSKTVVLCTITLFGLTELYIHSRVVRGTRRRAAIVTQPRASQVNPEIADSPAIEPAPALNLENFPTITPDTPSAASSQDSSFNIPAPPTDDAPAAPKHSLSSTDVPSASITDDESAHIPAPPTDDSPPAPGVYKPISIPKIPREQPAITPHRPLSLMDQLKERIGQSKPIEYKEQDITPPPHIALDDDEWSDPAPEGIPISDPSMPTIDKTGTQFSKETQPIPDAPAQSEWQQWVESQKTSSGQTAVPSTTLPPAESDVPPKASPTQQDMQSELFENIIKRRSAIEGDEEVESNDEEEEWDF